MHHAYATVNGIQLHFVQAGEGKRLLLLLHGFPEFWYAYKRQLEHFGATGAFTVVAPDLRGYNLSGKPAGAANYQIPHLVEDVRLLIEHLGFVQCILAGHDWGGVIAWNFTMLYPGYVQKLIIINAPHPVTFRRELWRNLRQLWASKYIMLLKTRFAEGFLSANNYHLLAATVFGHHPAIRHLSAPDQQAYLEAWAQPGTLTAAVNYYRAAVAFRQPAPAEVQILVPTLVLWGEQDRYLVPSILDGLEQYVPNSTIKRFRQASHWIIHEQPALVNEHIADFLK